MRILHLLQFSDFKQVYFKTNGFYKRETLIKMKKIIVKMGRYNTTYYTKVFVSPPQSFNRIV